MDLGLEVLTGQGQGAPQFSPDCVPPWEGLCPLLLGGPSPLCWATAPCSPLGCSRRCLLAPIHAACRPTAIAGGESDLGELGDCLSGSFKERLRWARHASAVT